MTKEEYSKKRNELTTRLEELTTLYKDQLQKMQTEIETILFKYKPEDTKVQFRTDINYCRDLSVEISFINEKGEEDFGSNFKFYIETKFGSYTYVTKMSHGTIGTYTLENIYQYYRLEYMLNLWKAEKDIKSQIVQILTNAGFENIIDQRRRVEREIDKLDFEWETQQKNEILESLEVGKAFKQKDDDRFYTWKITKITPQFVWYDFEWEVNGAYRSATDRKIRKPILVNYIYTEQLEPIS